MYAIRRYYDVNEDIFAITVLQKPKHITGPDAIIRICPHYQAAGGNSKCRFPVFKRINLVFYRVLSIHFYETES